MVSFDVELLKSSFQTIVVPRSEDFATRFFERLFHRHPALASIFAASTSRRKHELPTVLGLAVSSSTDSSAAIAESTALSQVYSSCGVQPQHYPQLEENLVAVLGEMGETNWTLGHADAWRERCRAMHRAIDARGQESSGRVDAMPRDSRGSGEGSETDPSSETGESDLLFTVSKYLELSRRWHEEQEKLPLPELKRWQQVRERLERTLGNLPLSGNSNRRFLRVPTSLDARFPGRSIPERGMVTQIGDGGIFVAADPPLTKGAMVNLEIVGDGDRFDITGIVAWTRYAPTSDGPPGMGVRFTDLDRFRRESVAGIIKRCLLVVLSEHSRRR